MVGIILAGGRASRLGGGDKGERAVAGTPILDRVIAALRPQCGPLILNANGDAARLARHGLPIVPDAHPGQPGPLAGVLAGLDHVAELDAGTDPQARFALTVPNDVPFLPHDLVARLQDRRIADRAAISCARSGGRTHHVVALWPVALRDELRRFLDGGGHKVGAFIARHPFALADWPSEPFDPFTNVNTPDDLARADRLADRVAGRAR